MRDLNLIEKRDNRPGEYGKDFMNIKCNSDDSLPQNIKVSYVNNKCSIFKCLNV